MSTLENALVLIAIYHDETKEIDGVTPYVSHLIHVAASMNSVEEMIVALLHDVVEDTEASIENLEGWEFSKEIVAAVDALTKRTHERYLEDYIRRVSENKLAAKVKMADLSHNLDLDRLGRTPTERDYERRRKYIEAKRILIEAEFERLDSLRSDFFNIV